MLPIRAPGNSLNWTPNAEAPIQRIYCAGDINGGVFIGSNMNVYRGPGQERELTLINRHPPRGRDQARDRAR